MLTRAALDSSCHARRVVSHFGFISRARENFTLHRLFTPSGQLLQSRRRAVNSSSLSRYSRQLRSVAFPALFPRGSNNLTAIT